MEKDGAREIIRVLWGTLCGLNCRVTSRMARTPFSLTPKQIHGNLAVALGDGEANYVGSG